jgi:anti-sigma regulatory factor (Ser/Thr protein kinase)
MTVRALRRVYDATAESVPAARHAVTAFAREAGVSNSRLTDIALAVSEACSNVVVHAYRDTAPGLLEVAARRPSDWLEIEVSDRGAGMAPRTDSPGMGVGLPLIAEVTDSFEVRAAREQGTRVVMRFPLL